MTYDYKKIITNLCSFQERQRGGETKAKQYILSVLDEKNITYIDQDYHVEIPRYTTWELKVDGQTIESLPCGLRSGVINPNNIISSLISSQKNPYDANINFNPLCPVISRSNHYHAPALAISRNDVARVVEAGEVEAYMNLESVSHTSTNVLVGNTKNPKHLIVSHYDSVGSGAVDNASGVALSLDLIETRPELLDTCCFAICANEEISFDEPVYWGHGYRVLEQEYKHLFEGVARITVVDSFGYSDIEVIQDKETLMLGFPVKSIDSLLHKTVMISGSYEGLMQFYHADNDVPDLIQDEYYDQARTHVLGIISE